MLTPEQFEEAAMTFCRAGWAIRVNGTLAHIECVSAPSVYDTLDEANEALKTPWLAADKEVVMVKVSWADGEYSFQLCSETRA